MGEKAILIPIPAKSKLCEILKISNFNRSTLVHWVQEVKDSTTAEADRPSEQRKHNGPSRHFRTIFNPRFREIINGIFYQSLPNYM